MRLIELQRLAWAGFRRSFPEAPALDSQIDMEGRPIPLSLWQHSAEKDTLGRHLLIEIAETYDVAASAPQQRLTAANALCRAVGDLQSSMRSLLLGHEPYADDELLRSLSIVLNMAQNISDVLDALGHDESLDSIRIETVKVANNRIHEEVAKHLPG